jgi:two-component system, cell cycle response regulator DivK
MTPPVVLVVDDDPRNRKLVRDVLRRDGLETIEAASARDAIALAGAHVPDLVLMDLRLPDLDGAEALRRLKSDPATAAIPVAALTAVAGARGALLEAGFAGYVEKPVDVGALPAEVRRLCRARRPAP